MQSESMWAIPEPLPACEVRVDDDSTTTFRRHRNQDGLRLIQSPGRLVLSRGNGLAVDVDYLNWSLLSIEVNLFVDDLWRCGKNGIEA